MHQQDQEAGAEQAGDQAPDPHPTRFKKGRSGNPAGRPPKGGRKADLLSALTLRERMIVILHEEWSDDDLRELAKTKPHTYQKLLELANKGEQGPLRPGPDGSAPAPPDEKTADIVALVDDLLARHGAQP